MLVGQCINVRIDGIHSAVRNFLGGHELRGWMILMNALLNPILAVDAVFFPHRSIPVANYGAVNERLDTRLLPGMSSQSLENVDGHKRERLVVGVGVHGD